MDDHDFVFVNNPLSEKENKEFSDFLRLRKANVKVKLPLRIMTRKRAAK